MSGFTDEQLQFIIDYDYSEVEKIPSYLKGIDENTRLILQQLEKSNEAQNELTTILMTEQEISTGEQAQQRTTMTTTEESTEEVTEEIPEEVAEEVTEEVTEEVVTEEVTEEPLPVEVEPTEEILAEETINYDEMILNELKLMNQTNSENQVALIEHLELIQTDTQVGREADTLVQLYLLWLVPFILIYLLFNGILKPFTRV